MKKLKKVTASSTAELDYDVMWDYLVEVVGVSEEALELLTAVNGRNDEAMCDALYVYTGYRDFDQIPEDERTW